MRRSIVRVGVVLQVIGRHTGLRLAAAVAVALMVVVAIVGSAIAQCELYGVYSQEVEFGDPPEGLLRIDTSTGRAEQIGLLDSAMVPFGLASMRDELYTFDQIADVIRRLNPLDGTTMTTVDVGIQEVGEGSLVLSDDGIGFLSGREGLYALDLGTETSELVREMERMDGLALGADGVLYGLDEGSYDLYVIEPITGIATRIGATGIDFGGYNNTGGLAFGPDGMLYAVNDSALYAIDPSTAEGRLIGETGWHDMQGLTFWNCDSPAVALQPGDANQDLQFDQEDLIQVLEAGKYLTGSAATWGDGDWDGAPADGFGVGNPPAGDGAFDQLDVMVALQSGTYLTGPYTAERSVVTPEPSTLILLLAGSLGIATAHVAFQSTAGRRYVKIREHNAGRIAAS